MRKQDTCLWGCAVLGLLGLLFVWAVAHVGQNLARRFRAAQNQYLAWRPLDQYWVAPGTNVEAAALLPERLAGYRRAPAQTNAPFAGWPLRTPGVQARYLTNGLALDLYLYPVEAQQQDQVYDQLQAAPLRLQSAEAPVTRKVVTRNGRLLSLQIRPPERHALVWGKDGWLFLVVSSAEADLDHFLREYLWSIRGVASNSVPAVSQP